MHANGAAERVLIQSGIRSDLREEKTYAYCITHSSLLAALAAQKWRTTSLRTGAHMRSTRWLTVTVWGTGPFMTSSNTTRSDSCILLHESLDKSPKAAKAVEVSKDIGLQHHEANLLLTWA